jgi:hypothetical protein
MADRIAVKLYRFEQAGRSKDWAFPVEVRSSDAELVVFFGVTGKALRQAVTPAACCVNHDPAAEARNREREKLGKGYRYLGEYQLNLTNRRELIPLAVTEAVLVIESERLITLSPAPESTAVLLAAVDTDEAGWFY